MPEVPVERAVAQHVVSGGQGRVEVAFHLGVDLGHRRGQGVPAALSQAGRSAIRAGSEPGQQMRVLKLGTVALDGMSISEELALREQRLAAIARARATIEARAKERHAREKGEHDAKMARRGDKTSEEARRSRAATAG